MTEPAGDRTQPAPTASRAWPAWRRRVLILLPVAALIAVVLGLVLLDGRFFALAFSLLWAQMFMVPDAAEAPAGVRDRGRSAWTPATLMAVAVPGGLAVGLVVLAQGVAGLGSIGVVVLAAAVLAAIVLVVVLVVAFRAQVRGDAITVPPFPELPATERRQARVGGGVLAAPLFVLLFLREWIPDDVRIWGPVAVVVGLAAPVWTWWRIRTATPAG